MSVSHGLLDQVENITRLASSASRELGAEGDIIQSNLSKYGCLLLSAAMERALIGGIADYGGRVGNERLRRFLNDTLSTGRNPTPEYIRDVLGRLETSWGESVWNYMTDEVGLDKVRSVVSNRNRIAHGLSVSLGVRSLLDWTPAVRKLCLEITRLTARQ